jgi:hypothetical protein
MCARCSSCFRLASYRGGSMKGNSTLRDTFLLCLALGTLSSCQDNGSIPPPYQFVGITETLNDPTPIGVVDADDWKPIFDCPPAVPSLPTCTKAYPVYPNPASGSCTLYFTVSQGDSIIITLYDRPNNPVSTIANRRFQGGAYSFTINLSGLQYTIHRLYFTVVRPSGTYTTYGDIEVVQ